MESLWRWRAEVRGFFLSSIAPQAEFSLATIADASNHHLTREAARLHRACGCTAAGLAMTLAILLGGAAIATDPRGPAGVPLLNWAGYFLFVIAAATAGKLAGLLWARRQMDRLARAVEALIGGGAQGQAR